MPPRRDLEAFESRAAGYERGWLGRLHHDIADRTADLALRGTKSPQRLLDIGCGTGYLLRSLAERCPEATALVGVDPASAMIAVASEATADPRLSFVVGVAEHLPYPDHAFDVIVSTTSFDHWSDQEAGLRECARVLIPGGQLILVDQFSLWLVPTLLMARRGKARTRRRATALLQAAGFRSLAWHDLYAVIISAVTATSIA